MFQSYTYSVTTEQRVGRRESERQEGEEMFEEGVVHGMEVEMEFHLKEQTLPKIEKKKLGKRQLHQLRSQQAAAMREKRLRKDLQLSGTESVKGRQLNVC